MEVARGKYFTFVDSDDYIRKDMIERLVNLIEKK
ncbi:MAG: glycosyltransferase [Sellimonas intestinalis]